MVSLPQEAPMAKPARPGPEVDRVLCVAPDCPPDLQRAYVDKSVECGRLIHERDSALWKLHAAEQERDHYRQLYAQVDAECDRLHEELVHANRRIEELS